MTKNIPCEIVLTADQIRALNEGTLGGNIQKVAFQIRRKYQDVIEVLNVRDNSYPLPEQIDEYFNVTEKQLQIEYLINQFMHNLNVKKSTKKNYGYIMNTFKKFFESNISDSTIKKIANKKTLKDFEFWFKSSHESRRIEAAQKGEKNKIVTPLTVFNNVYVVKMFLNFIADKYELDRVDVKLKQPKYSNKWHVTEEDVEQLLKYQPKTQLEADVLDIIRINKTIGLRISEILKIEPENIKEFSDYTAIRFIEEKKARERIVIIADEQARKIIGDRLLENKFWNIPNYFIFDKLVKKIAKEQFGEQTIKIYKVNSFKSGYEDLKKCDIISSHAFRRYAAERNISKYGIDVARTMGGWSDFQVITRHYAEFMNEEDLKEKLLKKK
ncbi:MAG: site-specific integrase [Bacteroidales bacterium]|nr:site-specific integrase [Bacteroidales bacterium]